MTQPPDLTFDELKDAGRAASERADAEWRDHLLTVLSEPTDDLRDRLRKAIWEADPMNPPYESLCPFCYTWNLVDDMANAVIKVLIVEIESRTG